MKITQNINWSLLREQKQALIRSNLQGEYKDGLLSLIDSIQDGAVSSGESSEEEVFGKYNEETGETEQSPIGDSKCECSDPECPIHFGKSDCTRKSCIVMFRKNMTNETGTAMCGACADDAFYSGTFTTP